MVNTTYSSINYSILNGGILNGNTLTVYQSLKIDGTGLLLKNTFVYIRTDVRNCSIKPLL